MIKKTTNFIGNWNENINIEYYVHISLKRKLLSSLHHMKSIKIIENKFPRGQTNQQYH